jgi:hypothetical protein
LKLTCFKGSDNFDWRDLRGLGKLLAWSFSIRNPCEEHDMKPTPRVAPEKFVETMKDEIEQYAKQVMEAVNQAPDGEWDRRQRGTRSQSLGGDAPTHL